MAKNVFILKIVDLMDNEHCIILGEKYSKIHIQKKNESKDLFEPDEFVEQILEFVKPRIINGIWESTLDFIVTDDRIISLSNRPFGEIEAKWFYIMANGNTITKFKPVHYSCEDLAKVWNTYKE